MKGKKSRRMLDNLRGELILISNESVSVQKWKEGKHGVKRTLRSQREEDSADDEEDTSSGTEEGSSDDLDEPSGPEHLPEDLMEAWTKKQAESTTTRLPPASKSRTFMKSLSVPGKSNVSGTISEDEVYSEGGGSDKGAPVKHHIHASLPDLKIAGRRRSIPTIRRNSEPSSISSLPSVDEGTSVFDYRKKSMVTSLKMMGKGNPRKKQRRWMKGGNGFEMKVLEGNAERKGSLTTRIMQTSNVRTRLQSMTSVQSELTHISESSSTQRRPSASGSNQGSIVAASDVGSKPPSRRMSTSTVVGTIKAKGVVKDKIRKRRLSLKSDGSEDTGQQTQAARARWRRRKELGEKFRRLCKFFVVLYRVWKFHSTRVTDHLDDSIDLLIQNDNDGPGDLLFDMSQYKAAKEARISQEAKRILQKVPGTRTDDELHYLRIALRNYPSIVEYPIHMQKKIAERGWYEGFDKKRVVTREGQIPMNFFFLLSGSVIVATYDEERGVNKTVCFLNRGDSFGELAIINRSRRETSVITKEQVELLSLAQDDFLEIFMSGGLGNPKDPFLCSLSCLKDWPLDLLGKNPKKAMFSFFKRGVVLSSDTTTSDWIYIIKSGSCQVLKKLRHETPVALKPRKSIRGKKLDNGDLSVAHEDIIKKKELEEAEMLDNSSTAWLRHLAQPEINIDTRDTYLGSKRKEMESNSLGGAKHMIKELNRSQYSPLPGGSTPKPFLSVPPGATTVLQPIEASRKTAKLATSSPFLTKTNKPTHPPGDGGHHGQDGPNKDIGTSSKDGGHDTAEHSMFVVVQTLTKGSVFGLADIVYGGQPSFSLVSNGAEIIMLNKKFYNEHSNQRVTTRLREEIYPFPNDDFLQEDLKRTVNWDFNRQKAMENTLRKLKLSKANVHDARSTLPTVVGT